MWEYFISRRTIIPESIQKKSDSIPIFFYSFHVFGRLVAHPP